MTAKEVAKALRICLPTLYKMANAGEIPAFKVRNEWRFDRNKVDDWIKGVRSKSNERKGRSSIPPARAGGRRPGT